MTAYHIIVKKTERVEEKQTKWQFLYTDAAFTAIRAETPEAKQGAYVEAVFPVTTETILYEQRVEDLNLQAVIEAVNPPAAWRAVPLNLDAPGGTLVLLRS